MPNTYDDHERRCPRLGTPVRFHYCRTSGKDPCFKVLDCWWEQFDVTAYFRKHLGDEAFECLANARPPDKVASLVEMIRQARERIQSEGHKSGN